MDTLGQVIDLRPALSADGVCEAALGVFVRDAACRVLAVVEDGRPVGLITREPFLARMEAPGGADRPIREVMEFDPLVADAAEGVRAFVHRIAATRPAALQEGFVVAADGRYLGVADFARLAGALVSPRDGGMVDRISAEIREPIANALAAAEGLRRMRLPDGALAHLDAISEAGRAAITLLETVADLQKAESGALALAPEPRRLQDLMDHLDARWRERTDAAGVTLLVSYDGQPDCVAMLDDARLFQVFDALIGHAMAYAGRGVIEASLRARTEDAGVVLTGRVRDNGAPYAPGYLADLFRGGDASLPGGAGVRIGLMLAERTLAVMAGRLEAAANTGPGATISFEFTAAAAETAKAEDEAAPASGPGRSAHILVVDDNATNRMVVEALCEMFDCSTESVVDGVEAVEAAKAGRFDVILMDIKMPRMDGVTAAREIRKLAGPAGRAPIIALTANADPDEVSRYLAAGMCAVVEKPIKPERLLEALESALAGGARSDTAAA
jgi:CheY-like chemotaxis protein